MADKPASVQPALSRPASVQPALFNNDTATVRSILIEKGLPADGVTVTKVGNKRIVTMTWNAFAGLSGEGKVIGHDYPF